MLRKFGRDRRGGYAIITALAMVPIMGALALAIDYTELSRQRQATLNALDAANIATAWQLLQGKSDSEVIAYAQEFFRANLGPVKPEDATLHVTLPSSAAGGGTLKMRADLRYEPIFYPVAQMLLGNGSGDYTISFDVSNEVRLKNTLEVALVLDNSGSMDERGFGSGLKRLDLLKAASKQLVATLAAQAGMMKQVAKPVQFGLVPFAASVNVGPDKANASWMDTDGLSSIHHENFDWETMGKADSKKAVVSVGGIYYKKGANWPSAERDTKVTRFTLYNDLKKRKSSIGWAGCVEMRPGALALSDAAPNKSNPDTYFVPMFAPDETDQSTSSGWSRRYAYNSWWPDGTSNSSARYRQTYMPKYYTSGSIPSIPSGKGPNQSCTTTPIMPLTDVTTPAGVETVEDAIDSMVAEGATNVPEGLAWGWRVVSGGPPFTEGRPDSERGNDKVVIVLTDGANTYYTPESLGAADAADNRSIYSNWGYARFRRIFDDTTVSKDDFSNPNYTRAMNQSFAKLCANAKAKNVILMTVALDLNASKADEREQIEALKACASESRFRKDPQTGKPAKLFWNATGADLSEKFKEIADELSNLRIVS